MTPQSTNDDDLGGWLHDGPTQAPSPLRASIQSSVAVTDQRSRRGFGLGGSWRRPTLAVAQAAAGVAIVAGLGVGVIYFASGGGQGGTGAPSTQPAAAATASALAGAMSPSAMASPAASAEGAAIRPPSAGPSVIIVPVLKPTPACGPDNTSAQITSWQGAMGQRIATVVLTNTSTLACQLPVQSRPQLVDGSGRVLIDSAPAVKSTTLTLGPGKHLTTLVEAGNYCGPAPSAPVRIGITLSAGERVIASAPTPTDATVPPCNGSAAKSDIQMHPWGG